MRAVDILQEPKRLKRRILSISAEIDAVRSSLMPGGINYEMDRVQGGAGNDRFADVMARKDELERRAFELERRYNDLVRFIIPELIGQISSDDAADIIWLHDVWDISMDIVADKMLMSRQNAYKLRSRGLEDIQRSLDEK